jgi:LPXTG-motif cell wall-anchored protein
MKKILSALTALCTALLFVVASALNVFAYNTSVTPTGDSTTIVIVVLAIILVASIVAIVLLSRKK